LTGQPEQRKEKLNKKDLLAQIVEKNEKKDHNDNCSGHDARSGGTYSETKKNFITQPNGSDSQNSPSPHIKPQKSIIPEIVEIEPAEWRIFQVIAQKNAIFRPTTFEELNQRRRNYRQRYLCCWRAMKDRKIEKSYLNKSSQDNNKKSSSRSFVPVTIKKEVTRAKITLEGCANILNFFVPVMYLSLSMIWKLFLIPIVTFTYPDYFFTEIKHTGRLGLALFFISLIEVVLLLSLKPVVKLIGNDSAKGYPFMLVFLAIFVCEILYIGFMLRYKDSFRAYTNNSGLCNMFLRYCTLIQIFLGLTFVLNLVLQTIKCVFKCKYKVEFTF